MKMRGTGGHEGDETSLQLAAERDEDTCYSLESRARNPQRCFAFRYRSTTASSCDLFVSPVPVCHHVVLTKARHKSRPLHPCHKFTAKASTKTLARGRVLNSTRGERESVKARLGTICRAIQYKSLLLPRAVSPALSSPSKRTRVSGVDLSDLSRLISVCSALLPLG